MHHGLTLLGRAVIAAALWAAVGSVSVAQPARDAELLYAQGQFQQAAAAGEASGSASGYAIAARALLARCMLSANAADDMAMIERARRNAQAALARDPESVEARLHLATALGMRAQRIPIAQALTEGLAGDGRRLIQEALARAPNDAWAHAMLGGWHLEVLRRGGAVGAAALGARLDQGLASFDRAAALAPNDPAILMQYAGSLLLLDASRHRARAAGLLDRAAGIAPRDAFERFAVAQAVRVSTVLRADGPNAAAQAVESLL